MVLSSLMAVSLCVSSEKGEELCITYKHHQALTVTIFSSLVSILTLELDDIFFLDRKTSVIYLSQPEQLFSVPQATALSHKFCGGMNPFYWVIFTHFEVR
jgi:hypothetical protein